MPFKVFYAWQSDRPYQVCRHLIRDALDDAKASLESDLEIQESLRDSIVVDQDTQGVSGSPPVAETILEKIREGNVFVADLTPTHTGPDDCTTPNPNVLIEYGYALHALGHRRIIGVFNEAYGTTEELPFDLQHRRWPIRYRLSKDNGPESRRKVRKQLTKQLANALRSSIREFSESGALATPSSAPDVFAVSRPVLKNFPWDTPLVRPATGEMILLSDGPAIYLNLRPHHSSLDLNNLQAQPIAWESLRPLADCFGGGTCIARTRHGPAVFAISNTDSPTVLDASLLVRDGSLYGIDCSHLRTTSSDSSSKPLVPTLSVEQMLITGLDNFLSVARHQLELQLPLDVRVGFEGVDGHFLGVDPSYFSKRLLGPILEDTLEDSVTVHSYTVDPFDLLLPFFQKVYDAVGRQRPSVPTVWPR